MKRNTLLLFGLILIFTFSLATFAKDATFTGKISDSMCGLKHGMSGLSDKQCTEACVGKGSKYVLADETNQKVYDLDSQVKAKPFPGEAVVVKGTLKNDGKTIHVVSIEQATK